MEVEHILKVPRRSFHRIFRKLRSYMKIYETLKRHWLL